MTEDEFQDEDDFGEEEEKSTEVEERVEYDQLLADFGYWLEETPSEPMTRQRRIVATWFHLIASVATGGVYLLAYVGYYFLAFLDEVDMEDYKKDVKVVEVE